MLRPVNDPIQPIELHTWIIPQRAVGAQGRLRVSGPLEIRKGTLRIRRARSRSRRIGLPCATPHSRCETICRAGPMWKEGAMLESGQRLSVPGWMYRRASAGKRVRGL